MHQRRHESFRSIMMIVVAVSTSVASAAQQQRYQETEIDEQATEWVEITVHMPDGRTFTRREQRFPSRSRVLIHTGMIPAFSAEPETGTAVDAGSEVPVSASSVNEDATSVVAEIEPGVSVPIESDDTSEESTDSRSGRVFKKTPRS